MKKNYYQILDIEQDADLSTIKKAYFSMVRRFPPERHPDEFMKIREAYETLSNKKAREEYDSMVSMSKGASLYFNAAQDALESADWSNAVEILEEGTSKIKNFSKLYELLGEAYLHNENPQKAVRTFEKLVNEFPDNAAYVGKLADACLHRGWHLKAQEAFNNAIQLDDDNISFRIGLAKTYEQQGNYAVCRQLLEEVCVKTKEVGWNYLEAYMGIIRMDIYLGDEEKLNKHLDDITLLAELQDEGPENDNIRDSAGYTLSSLSDMFYSMGIYKLADTISDAALKLRPNDEELLQLKEKINNSNTLYRQFEALFNEKGMQDSPLVEYIRINVFSAEDLEYDYEQREAAIFWMEHILLLNAEQYKSNILAIKREYPELFNHRQEFFNKVLDLKRNQKYLDQHYRKAHRYKWFLDEMSDYDYDNEMFSDEDDYDNDMDYEYFQKPYEREQPKVGRNSPCPCGSGKKYKKCCLK